MNNKKIYLHNPIFSPQLTMRFDYIIVGAGSAGCVLANRLSENPATTVLLLEAGGPDTKMEIHIPAGYAKLHRSAVDWGFWSEPQAALNGTRIYLPRGKTLGGSSSTNAMAYVRGNREDYNDWAQAGNPGWRYDDVLPYFIRSEQNQQAGQLDPAYHGTGGPLSVGYATRFRTPLADAFVDACQQTGIPLNHDPNGARQNGAGLLQFTIRDGKRQSTATAFLKPVLNRPNLKVITRAMTKQVLLDKGQAIGVEFFSGKHATEKAYANREVILSAGAFQSPHILLLSGVGPAHTLRQYGIPVKHELPGVGKNLQDHAFTGVSALASQPVSTNRFLTPWGQLSSFVRYALTKSGPLTCSPLEANAFINLEAPDDRVDFQFHFAPLHLGSDYKANLYDINTLPRTDGFSILPILLKPKSRGCVGLRSASPLDAPLIQPNFYSHEDDRRMMLKGIRKALDIIGADAFSPYRKEVLLPPKRVSDDDLWLHVQRLTEALYHPVGTCKMGTDELAVVDPELRAHGIGGLRVVDASIMPTIVSGNTNAPVIMIAEKAADLILG